MSQIPPQNQTCLKPLRIGLLAGSGARTIAAVIRPAIHKLFSAVAATSIVVPSLLSADTQQPPNRPEKSISGKSLPDGRSFAGILLTETVQKRDTLLKSDRAWSWTENGTRRLFLQGDVELKIGLDSFKATKATVWIQPIHEPGQTMYQLAVYFDRVESPLIAAGISHEAVGLLVTAVIQGELNLRTDLLQKERPNDAFIEQGEHRFAGYLAQLAEPAKTITPPVIRKPEEEETTPTPPARIPPLQAGNPIPEINSHLPEGPFRRPDESNLIFADDGIVTIDADDLHGELRDGEAVIALTGNVYFHYSDIEKTTKKHRRLVFTAERAVIFLRSHDAGALKTNLRAAEIDGIYLESNVTATGSESRPGIRTVTDSFYTLRGQYMFYDVRAQRAVVADAVFSTFDKKLRQPIYVRAKAIQQEAANQWKAHKAIIANSSFFEPHFSIGATRLTITQEDIPTANGETETRNYFDARNVTLRASNLPFFYWPRLQGHVEDMPLKEVGFSDSRDKGLNIHTEWDAFTLLGLNKPDGIHSRLLLDWSEHRRVGVGADIEYKWNAGKGKLFTYYINDHGRDRFSNATEMDRARDNRGMFQFQHRQSLTLEWSLLAEFAYITDPAFLDVFFDDKAETGKEFETQIFLAHNKDNAQFSFLFKPDLITFTPNEYLLLSQGYQVEKLPELRYTRFADLLGNAFSYSSDTTLSRMRISLPDITPRQLGLIFPAWSGALFGADPRQNLTDLFHAQGIDDNYVLRFDTRHEISLPVHTDNINMVPYVVGRFTVYDDDFNSFNGDDDNMRFWSAAGIRASTSIQHIDDSVENRILGLHRLRHIIEPNISVWSAWTTIDSTQLLVYDREVEPLAQGQVVKLGLKQTFETMRGGPGRWHNTQWLTLDGNLFLTDSSIDVNPQIPRYIDFRPEYSALGDHATGDAIWLVSDALAFSGNIIWDMDENKAARWSAGYDLHHTAEFSSFVEGRFVDAINQTLLDFGANFKLSYRYNLVSRISFDADEENLREVRMTLSRKSPQWTIFFGLSYDRVRQDTSFSLELSPNGFGRRAGINSRDLR